MLSRIVYFLRETLISLRRNFSMTVAAVLTIFVTLSLVGVAMLVFFWNLEGKQTVEKAVRFEIFLLPTAEKAQIDDVRAQLEKEKEEGRISKITFYSKKQAYEFFKKSFKDNEELVKSITAEDLPVSFLVAPTRPDENFVQDLMEKYNAIPGVDNVVSANYQDEIDRAEVINQTLALFAVVLLIASCVLVYNTVRLAVYARRREIEIMKLVGASNWFVQVPFLAEGAIQGLVGGIFAGGSALLFKSVILDQRFSDFRGFAVTPFQASLTVIVIVLMGILVGLASSWVGLKRYLDI